MSLRMYALKPSERHEIAHLVMTEGRFVSFAEAATFVEIAESHARALHTLYTHQCNRPLSGREEAAIEGHEKALKESFAAHGLGLYLNGDPRGNPVGILTPKTGKYNTMGGAECGWRL